MKKILTLLLILTMYVSANDFKTQVLKDGKNYEQLKVEFEANRQKLFEDRIILLKQIQSYCIKKGYLKEAKIAKDEITILTNILSGQSHIKEAISRPTVKKETPTVTYWITRSSSKRHNSSCRWYGNSKGYTSTRKEGIACKICGG